jgi:hypothetical protein
LPDWKGNLVYEPKLIDLKDRVGLEIGFNENFQSIPALQAAVGQGGNSFFKLPEAL